MLEMRCGMFVKADTFLEKIRPNQKINYDSVLRQMTETWKSAPRRPKLLIQSCCGPCSTYVLEMLVPHADIILYFFNPNIHPLSEYELRRDTQRRFIEEFNRTTGSSIVFMEGEYVPELFFKRTEALKDEPEGGKRCWVCYRIRMEHAAERARELGCDYFASTLTVSPMKNSNKVNEFGLEIQQTAGIYYLPSDFKKTGGYQRSIQLSKSYELYRQSYCGCIYSKRVVSE